MEILENSRRKLHLLPILSNLQAFRDALPAKARGRRTLLALDVSKTAIGLAGSDPEWRLATPLATIRRNRLKNDLAALQGWLEAREAGAVIIGLPLNMDGSEGPRCQSIRQFARDADLAFGLPILLWDERLTTFAAGERADEMGLKGKKRAEMLDALAACLILEDAIAAMALRPKRNDQRGSEKLKPNQ
ncbi:MAG: Holliday junction resolvase RuvX [Alphaproteobacteria bacterium]|nr:Holliday junction resolvase RuvX [Alphaproteobacteria bacterium]